MEDVNGNGFHVHQSLFSMKGFKSNGKNYEEGEQNAFYDPKDKMHLSQVGRHYVAGLLNHSREIALVTNQWTNSYKRLVAGFEAPT
ncbi:MAG: hypothetical protein IH898_14010, partial [Planctomycetes bacterium]|nr:hypothetical protein [Planctomycetota bacterium]